MAAKGKNKKKKWVKFRHKVVRDILNVLLTPYMNARYHVRVKRHKDKRQCLILMNHQTAFDQFFVGHAFSQPVYYVASEDLFSNGWISSLIKHLVAPIPIRKQATDPHAVMNCLRVMKEGGTIAMAPEGNRTYSGKTEYINPALVPFVKKLGLPIAFFRIEGGYGIHPRWSDVVRKGKMRAYVSRVMEPQEYQALSSEELFQVIEKELSVNEANADECFYHKKNAEYLERVFYVCPYCGLSRFESDGDIIECKKCGRKIRYLPTKEFRGEGFDFPFRFVNDWYEYQKDFVNRSELSEYNEAPMYEDTARFSEVIVYKNKKVLDEAAGISLYGNRIVILSQKAGELTFFFDDISAVTVLGRNKLNIYYNKRIYQLKSDKRFNALKYVYTFYHYKNLTKGGANDKFLGL